MTKAQFGMFLAAVGVATFAMWQRLQQSNHFEERGEVIFSNAPR